MKSEMRVIERGVSLADRKNAKAAPLKTLTREFLERERERRGEERER